MCDFLTINQTPIKNRTCTMLNLSFFSAMLLCMAFSPVISFYFGIIYLAIFSSFIDENTRRLSGIIILFSGVLMYSSRAYFVPSDDIVGYYNAFESFYTNGLDIAHFGFGYAEFVTSIYFWFLGLIFGKLSPSGLIFFSSLASTFIFWLWIELYGLKEVSSKNQALCVASTMLFFNFMLSTQLVRQMLAISLIFHALSVQDNWKRYIIIIIAIFTHSSALPIFLIMWGLLSNPRKTCLLTFLASGLLIVFQGPIISFFLGSFLNNVPIIEKFSYFERFGLSNIHISIRFVSVVFVLVLSFILVPDKNMVRTKWKYFTLGFCLIYFQLLPFKYLAVRLAMPMGSFLLGYLIFFSVKRLTGPYTVILVFFCLFSFVRLALFYEVPQTGFPLWATYPYVSKVPFYFFYNF